jgi:hypothetical protein
VNERIKDLSSDFLVSADDAQEYICECLDPACTERIPIPHEEYERIRRNATEFFVIPGHEDLQVEEVVDTNDRWLVVRKIGVGGEVATHLAAAPERRTK